jgi:hypothetical protein
LNVL